ncbi:hypothetical protein ZHAS_00000703 [Anopheles sinensis]|uniref:Uncharacterized protein n=1 Tax=Anopheles sinensis TaxID=74873 RepID=A0A084VAG0_ANOSI|nr:hypothetical protein ZHAS_00000703 [Anopheles sinensis]
MGSVANDHADDDDRPVGAEATITLSDIGTQWSTTPMRLYSGGGSRHFSSQTDHSHKVRGCLSSGLLLLGSRNTTTGLLVYGPTLTAYGGDDWKITWKIFARGKCIISAVPQDIQFVHGRDRE